MSVPFEPVVPQWIEGLGLIRNVVRQAVLAAQLTELIAERWRAPIRVLDVGCGQGTQALALARGGHHVTGLDLSKELLAEFAAALADEPDDVRTRVRLVQGPGERAAELTGGGFDLALCHGVLMYFDDPQAILRALSAAIAPGGLISLLVRNGMARAMRSGLQGDYAAATAAFDTRQYVNGLGLAARAHTPEEVDTLLGWRREHWFGVRVFSDHLDGPPPPARELAALIRAETEAGRRDPYRSVAGLLHLVYARASDQVLGGAVITAAGATRAG